MASAVNIILMVLFDIKKPNFLVREIVTIKLFLHKFKY